MIKTPTTFVVGAGASRPYNLPLGATLKSQVGDRLRPGDPVYVLLMGCGFESEELNEFRELLSRHPGSSIDEYLYNRPDQSNHQKIGRAVIAILMGIAMQGAWYRQHDDWIEIVLSRMAEGARNLDAFVELNTGVNFLTFNFDSVIETRTRNYLVNRYRDGGRIDFESAAKKTCPVIHIHGHLPVAPQEKQLAHPINGPIVEWVQWVQAAAPRVRVIHDGLETENSAQLNSILLASRVIVCLGFAYQAENLQKLTVEHFCRDTARSIFGTAMEITAAKRDWIVRQFNGVIKLSGGNCVHLLEQVGWHQD